MKQKLAIIICSLLLVGTAKAAFRDFIVEQETDELHGEPSNDVSLGCSAAVGEQPQISFHDVQQDGIVDPQLLLTALMQHAQRLGLNLEQLASMHAIEEDDIFGVSDTGCSAAGLSSYQEQHSWYDVFFN